METTYADSWPDMAQSYDIDLWVMKWRSAWPIFHSPVILPCISKTIWCLYFGIMNQYDPRFDLKINVGHCDLYFMVQWFCLVSWRLFDVWTSLFGVRTTEILKSKSVRSTDDVIRTCVRQSQIVTKTYDIIFIQKCIRNSLFFWYSVIFELAQSVYGWGKRPKRVCQSWH